MDSIPSMVQQLQTATPSGTTPRTPFDPIQIYTMTQKTLAMSPARAVKMVSVSVFGLGQACEMQQVQEQAKRDDE